MFVCPNDEDLNLDVKLYNKNLENVSKYNYLGVTI